MIKKVLKAGAVLLVLAVGLYLVQRLLVPKYVTNIPEGSMIEEYYKSSKNHDVVFIGDCEVYENISPVTMWENYGISSYVRGSADQYIWQSYYMLEDTLRYETPDVVVVSVLAMRNDTDVSEEAYNRMTLDGMKWSSSKLNAIKASMKEDETLLSYVFPLLRYHSRWSELTLEDLEYFFDKPSVTTNGYLMQVGVRPVTTVPRVPVLSDYAFPENNMEYLSRMKSLCDEKGVKLVLLKAPSIYPHWYDEYDSQIVDFANANGVYYINSLKDISQTGIDFTTDTFDYGQHLNVDGAEKFSRYLGKVLCEQYNLSDHREDEAYVSEWKALTDEYYKEKETKLKGLED